MLAAIRNLNRLELAGETMHAALGVVVACALGWLGALAPAQWYEPYAQRASDYHLLRSHVARDAYVLLTGRDGYLLPEALHRVDAAPWLRHVSTAEVPRRVWVQRYYRDEQTMRWRGKSEPPPFSALIVSPCEFARTSSSTPRPYWGRK